MNKNRYTDLNECLELRQNAETLSRTNASLAAAAHSYTDLGSQTRAEPASTQAGPSAGSSRAAVSSAQVSNMPPAISRTSGHRSSSHDGGGWVIVARYDFLLVFCSDSSSSCSRYLIISR